MIPDNWKWLGCEEECPNCMGCNRWQSPETGDWLCGDCFMRSNELPTLTELFGWQGYLMELAENGNGNGHPVEGQS